MRKAFTVFCAGLVLMPGVSPAQGTMPPPPVPGPYPLSIAVPAYIAPPAFARPAPAMAVPYWMQGPAGGVATPAPAPQGDYASMPPAAAPAADAGVTVTAPAPAPGNGARYGQAAAPGFFPTYRAQPVGPGAGQPIPTGPAQGSAQGPGWSGPAWVPQPYMAAPWMMPNAPGGRQ